MITITLSHFELFKYYVHDYQLRTASVLSWDLSQVELLDHFTHQWLSEEEMASLLWTIRYGKGGDFYNTHSCFEMKRGNLSSVSQLIVPQVFQHILISMKIKSHGFLKRSQFHNGAMLKYRWNLWIKVEN